VILHHALAILFAVGSLELVASFLIVPASWARAVLLTLGALTIGSWVVLVAVT